MKSAREDGRLDALRELIGKKLEKGMSPEDIAELFELELDEVRELAEEWKKSNKDSGKRILISEYPHLFI